MDCGSGHDFVLPHLSSADREGPNKLLDNVSTVPMKVCNGLVHGDRRSHVILSPGVIGATANHAIECLIVMINDVLEVHGVMPDVFTLQSDGASTNKNILMLAFLALLVMEGVFRTARLCMELEHHAHDVYDAFQAIHARLVRHSTYFYLEELISLIESAHVSSGDQEEQNPVVGHDVKVSNLWEVRDFWEWLAPGYTEKTTRPYALANAAFSYFSSLHGYRDFQVKLEVGSTPQNPKVGLWAKAYMTSHNYEYLGTLLTKESFESVTRGRAPPMQDREVAECKTSREESCKKDLKKVSTGRYALQFPPERVADGIAVCERRWEHFSSSKGALTPMLQRLPAQLAAELRRRGLRHAVDEVPVVNDVPEVRAEREHAETFLTLPDDVPPPALNQYHHGGAEYYGFRRGDRTTIGHLQSKGIPSDDDFKSRPVYPGCFVITRPAPSSHWAKVSPKLRSLDFWLWQVRKAYPPGSIVPGYTDQQESWTYEGQLYHPYDGTKEKGRWKKTWERAGPKFMMTVEEKQQHEDKKKKKERKDVRVRLQQLLHPYSKKSKEARRKAQLKERGPASSAAASSAAASNAAASSAAASSSAAAGEDTSAPTHVPLTSYLRPCNIIGGGFVCTRAGFVPRFVIAYWERHCRGAGVEGDAGAAES